MTPMELRPAAAQGHESRREKGDANRRKRKINSTSPIHWSSFTLTVRERYSQTVTMMHRGALISCSLGLFTMRYPAMRQETSCLPGALPAVRKKALLPMQEAVEPIRNFYPRRGRVQQLLTARKVFEMLTSKVLLFVFRSTET